MLHLIRKKKKADPSQHHHTIDYLAEANAIFGGIALYPQLIEAWKTHDISGLSTATFVITFTANIIWALYGLHRKDMAVIVSAVLVIFSSGGLLAFILLYR